MSMPIDNKNFYKLISFTSFSGHFTQPFFFEGNAMEMKLHRLIVLSLPYIYY